MHFFAALLQSAMSDVTDLDVYQLTAQGLVQNFQITLNNGQLSFDSAGFSRAVQSFQRTGEVELSYRTNGEDSSIWLHKAPFADTCPKCHLYIGSKDLMEHLSLKQFCSVHNACFSQWKEHNRSAAHLTCAFCPDLSFGSDKDYKVHFGRYHRGT